MRTLLIDNYDSYTYNLFQIIAEISGSDPHVITNDCKNWKAFTQNIDNVVISPGPGRPERQIDFGLCIDLIMEVTYPVLGVCLGHQGSPTLLVGGSFTLLR